MRCFTCKTEMKCYNDVCEEGARIDFVECPKCQSRADIIYGNRGEYINRVLWFRD